LAAAKGSQHEAHDRRSRTLNALAVAVTPGAASIACAAVAILVGSGVLLGWATGIESLKSISPSFSQMKANTALCFILAGISLLLLRNPLHKHWSTLGKGLAGIISLLALLTLFEYIAGSNLGIDELLFRDPNSAAAFSPGRMGANSAFGFTLVGFALLALDTERRGIRPTQVAAIVVSVMAFVAILGYAYGASTLDTSFITKTVTPMSLYTALTLPVLAAGLMLARPDKGMMVLIRSKGPGGHLLRRFLLPVVLVPPLVGYVRLKGQEDGLYGLVEGLAIYATTLVVVFGGLVWLTARSLQRERNRGDKERSDLEAQLRQAQKMEAIGRLAGGVAHDFNNLLTVITGYTDIQLGELEPGDPRREGISQIKAATDRATALTAQLLAFSRHQILEPRAFDLNVAVAEIAPMLKRVIGENIDFTTKLDPDLHRVWADPNQIHQAILNLAVNARDAMPKGGRLTLETDNVELDQTYVVAHPAIAVEPGDYAMLSVTDSGVGIEAKTLARIFDPFFTTKGPAEGTGLGLSTVYGIATQSGGGVWAYSEPGHGTSFKIYLPRVDVADGTTEPEETPSVEPETEATETVLLVEDEQAVRVLTHRILDSSGYTVLDAANGGEAIALCESHEGLIDLLLTDMVMPGISGIDLSQELRVQRPALKVLVMSGYSELAIDDQERDTNVAFLQKPFSANSLRLKVGEVLRDG